MSRAGRGRSPSRLLRHRATRREREGLGPTADSGEGVELPDADEISASKDFDRSSIDIPPRQLARENQFLEPRLRVGLDIVVEMHRAYSADAMTNFLGTGVRRAATSAGVM